MNNKNMTALVSCFSRAYHYKNKKIKIFSDSLADKILTSDEYNSISTNMSNGIKFFNPNFSGDSDEALEWIVDNQLSPSVLGRSAFCEDSLINSLKLGCRQCLIYAAGYDTFAYRNNYSNLSVFEIDKEEIISDKIKRLDYSNINHDNVSYIKCDFTTSNWFNKILDSKYDTTSLSFNSLLGISYYLSKDEFISMLEIISKNICEGSSILFDYPTDDGCDSTLTNERLAKGANEEMKSKYSYFEIEEILSDMGLLVYKHLDDKEMTERYFYNYNTINNNKMSAPRGVNYCLAVKKATNC